MRYQVQPNKLIRHGSDTFFVRGAAMFGGLFISFENRADFMTRGPTGSKPHEYGTNGEIMRAKLSAAYAAGVNTVRVSVEPAMLAVSGELDMLDTIVAEAASYGIVVSLTSGQPSTTQAQNVTFWQSMAAHYAATENVWINPKNEIGCTPRWINGVETANPNCLVPSAWEAEIAAYVAAIRGTGFKNPVVINPPAYGFDLSLVVGNITANATLRDDPNLIIGVHQYSGGAASFLAGDLAITMDKWAKYLGEYCIINEELGMVNFPGPLDPNLNIPPLASVDMALWGRLQSWMHEHLTWAASLPKFSGIIGNNWEWYIPGMQREDDCSMHRPDGSWSTWGAMFRDKWLSPSSAGLWKTSVDLALGSTGMASANRTYRIRVAPSMLTMSGNKARLTLKGPASGTPANIGGVHIGYAAETGDSYDFASTPVPVTFGGSIYSQPPLNGASVSDEIAFAVDKNRALLVSFSVLNDASIPYGGFLGCGEWNKPALDSATVNASGYNYEGTLSVGLSKVEVFG